MVIRAPPSSQLKEGDAIFGTAPPFVGTLAEEILVPLDQIAPKPPSLSFRSIYYYLYILYLIYFVLK
jgi:hypothetical protein